MFDTLFELWLVTQMFVRSTATVPSRKLSGAGTGGIDRKPQTSSPVGGRMERRPSDIGPAGVVRLVRQTGCCDKEGCV